MVTTTHGPGVPRSSGMISQGPAYSQAGISRVNAMFPPVVRDHPTVTSDEKRKVDQVGKLENIPLFERHNTMPNMKAHIHLPESGQRDALGDITPSQPSSNLTVDRRRPSIVSGTVVVDKSRMAVRGEKIGEIEKTPAPARTQSAPSSPRSCNNCLDMSERASRLQQDLNEANKNHKEEQDKLNKRIAELERLSAKPPAKCSKCPDLEAKLKENEKALSDCTGKLKESEKGLAAEKKTTADLRAKLAKLQSELDGKARELEEKNNQKAPAPVIQKVEVVKEVVKIDRNGEEALRAQINSMKHEHLEEIAGMQSQHDQNMNKARLAHEQEMDTLKSIMNQLEGEVRTLRTTVNEAEGTIKALQRELDGLRRERKEMGGDADQAMRENAALQKQIDELKAAVDVEKQKYEDLEGRMFELERKVTILGHTNTSLHNDNKKLQAKLEEAVSKNKLTNKYFKLKLSEVSESHKDVQRGLVKHAEGADDLIKKQKTNMEKLQDELNQLSEENGELRKKYRELAEKYEDVKKRLSGKKEPGADRTANPNRGSKFFGQT